MRCFHCTEDVLDSRRWQVNYNEETHDVCCVGCEAVAQAIIDAGLGDYYRFRTEPAQFGVIPNDLSAKLDALAVFDEPEISERYLLSDELSEATESIDNAQVSLSVEGLQCGACVWVLERSLNAAVGVSKASVNYASARATVRFNRQQLKLSEILRIVARVGYSAQPFDAKERELSLQKTSRTYLQRLFIAGIASMQVMMYALPNYISEEGDIAAEHVQLFRWASFIITTPVILYSATPFFKGALADLKSLKPGMDVPVCIGLFAAFSASVWNTVFKGGEIYFDSVAMFVFLLLGARYLEWITRRRAMRSVDDIIAAAPETALLKTEQGLETVPAARLMANDVIKIDSGQRVPVDGIVRKGSSAIDNSLVTGESLPVVIQQGDAIAGGALLTGAPIWLTVLRKQSASTLSVIDQLIERGASEKPAAVLFADRVATYFVSVLLVLTGIVYGYWALYEPSMAATTAIAVLVVSCPCALSLATPAALAAATGALLKVRMLITRGYALETLAQVTDIVFDKTGTLTRGEPSVIRVQAVGEYGELDCLRKAVALEDGSAHPYANALRAALHDYEFQDSESRQDFSGSSPMPTLASLKLGEGDLEHAVGHGVRAQLAAGKWLYLGSAEWCGFTDTQKNICFPITDSNEDICSEVFLVERDFLTENTNHPANTLPQPIAKFSISDVLRTEAYSLTNELRKNGYQLHLLSGDCKPVVESVASQLGIDHRQSSAKPEDKQAYVSELQGKGAIVLMIGDGINDAPVLARANVSLAAGNATALARTAADVISLLPGLEGLRYLLSQARRTSNIIQQNLAWAASYNACAIPLAALGFVPPWAAAIGMASSSLLVVLNSQRLWKHRGPLHEALAR